MRRSVLLMLCLAFTLGLFVGCGGTPEPMKTTNPIPKGRRPGG
jgi:hypothetical protein